MKKGIKIIFLGGLALTLFLNIFAFPSSAQAAGCDSTDFNNSTLLSDVGVNKTPLINALKQIYESLAWKKCTCPYKEGTTTKYECKVDGVIQYNYQDENEIESYLNGLKTCGEFTTELACLQSQSLMSFSGDPSDASRGNLIAAAKNYLQDPSDENKNEVEKLTGKLSLDVKVERGEGEGIFATAIGELTKALIWSIQPSSYGGYTIGNTGVRTIWKITRNFVNIGLIIAMILMAIATILGIEKYSWKKVLWKIIIVALLVNFSLVIVGMIVDLFNYFTVYFLNSAKITAANFDNLFSFQSPTLGILSLLKDLTAWFFKKLILIFVGIFVIIILLAALLSMIARAIIIMFLAAISPLAFAAWIFPDTEKWWKMWWDNFLKWASFGLLFAISLYVGMTIMSTVSSQISASGDSLLVNIGTTLMAAIFLLVGLIFSMQSGTAASQFILAQAGKASGAISKWTGRRIKEGVIESATYKKVGQKLMKSRMPLLKGAGLRMVSGGAKERADRIKSIEKEIENLSLGDLLTLTQGPIPNPKLDRAGYELRVAATNKLAGMGKLNKESVGFIKKYKDDNRFDQKAIVEAVPHLFHFENGEFKETGPSIENKVSALKDMKPKKIENIQGDNFINDTVNEARAKAYRDAKNNNMTDSEAEAAAKKIADKTFEDLIQEIVKQLSSPQLAALYAGIGNKAMKKYGWERKEGKIYKAIQKLAEVRQKFNNDLLTNKLLKERSGFMPSEEEQPPQHHIGFMRK